MLTYSTKKELAIFGIAFCCFMLSRILSSGAAYRYGSALAEIVAVLYLIVLVAKWRWMRPSIDQSAQELGLKAGFAALLLGLSVIAAKAEMLGRSAVRQALFDFVSMFGLVGVVLFAAFAFAATRKDAPRR